MGKSSAALSIAKNVAMQGRGVAFFSLEMTEPELGLRMACDVAFNPMEPQYSGEDSNPSYSKAEWGSLDEGQWERLQRANKAMASWPVMFDARPALSVAQVSSAARRIVRNWRKASIEPGCIIVDHLGLLRPERNMNNKVAEIGEISGALREMAKALEVPVIALCQLSRDVEKREGKDRRPGLSDLRWAGELEQDAHVVMFLYRPEYYIKEPVKTGDEIADDTAYSRYLKALSEHKNRLWWIIAKNRQGPTADAETFCRIECSAIRDLPRAA
jgi:replicative DNA helicase